MFNTERVPVKVYRWDDEGAPRVSIGAGDIKTILKACLVTGYGENENRKEPLGWEMPFEANNDACFRSKHDKSTKWALGVYGRADFGGVNVVALKNPEAVNKGEKEVILSRDGRGYKFVYRDVSGRGSNIKWVVIGHARAFCLIILNPDYASTCSFLFFGDFPSLLAADNNNCVLIGVAGRSVEYRQSSDLIDFLCANLMSNYKGDSPTECSLEYKSKGFYRVSTYPNPITGGFIADDIYIGENDSGVLIRGMLPGMVITNEKMPSNDTLAFGTVFDLAGSNDKWLYFRNVDQRGILVNMTAWEG